MAKTVTDRLAVSCTLRNWVWCLRPPIEGTNPEYDITLPGVVSQLCAFRAGWAGEPCAAQTAGGVARRERSGKAHHKGRLLPPQLLDVICLFCGGRCLLWDIGMRDLFPKSIPWYIGVIGCGAPVQLRASKNSRWKYTSLWVTRALPEEKRLVHDPVCVSLCGTGTQRRLLLFLLPVVCLF